MVLLLMILVLHQVHFIKNSYYLGIGNVTNDITKYTVNNCIVNYDLQKTLFDNYSYYNKPTAMHTFNLSGVETVIFGDSSGQCINLMELAQVIMVNL